MDFSPNVPNGGDYYSVKMNGDEWAVLICDEDMTVEYFTGEGRPLAARQADGTWGQEYRAGGSAFRQRCFPALCLGTMEL